MAADITIEIRADGQYAQSGSPMQFNVVVFVGQKVEWKNLGGAGHTATSDLSVDDGEGGTKRLFDTGNIAGGGVKEIEFTLDMYNTARTALKVPADGDVHLGYFCANHPDTMGGKIIFFPDEDRAKRAIEAAKSHGFRQ